MVAMARAGRPRGVPSGVATRRHRWSSVLVQYLRTLHRLRCTALVTVAPCVCVGSRHRPQLPLPPTFLSLSLSRLVHLRFVGPRENFHLSRFPPTQSLKV